VKKRLAINGYGRIGRCVLRALHESPWRESLDVVLINEPADIQSMAYLTRFDSTHGRFPGEVTQHGEHLRIDGRDIAVTHASSPQALDWSAHRPDLLIECSGRYSGRDELTAFLSAGCPRLLLSHPASDAAAIDNTVVFGVNQHSITPAQRLISAASCSTNAIVPVLTMLDETWGVEQVLITMLHSVMNDQPPIDGYHHTDLRRTRSAMQSIVPVATGLARGVVRMMPRLAGRVEAKSIRVPVANVSAIDMVVQLATATDASDLNARLRAGIAARFAAQMHITDEPHASIDFNHSPYSGIIDASQTRCSGAHLASLFVWFDNEWAFANRLLDLAAHTLNVDTTAALIVPSLHG
jgi:D-erythrose 4-phosphate dehydrogenase